MTSLFPRMGKGLSAVIGLFLFLGGTAVLLAPSQEMCDGFAMFGYPQSALPWIGGIEALCATLYLIPRTSVLGALLLTGYLGGATATHVRMGDPLFVVAPLVGILTWLGLYLRDERVKTLIPFLQPATAGAGWGSRIASGLPLLFLIVDGVGKLIKPAQVVDATVQLGYPEWVILPLGVVLLLCVAVHAFPRTAVIGLILLTGYLGGAVATQVRMLGPAFNIVFPIILAVLLWGGLWLREPRLREIIPLNRRQDVVP